MAKELTQEEIDALINGGSNNTASNNVDDTKSEALSSEEKDMLGEFGNISMGNSATAIAKILNRKVNITTPKVTIINISQLAKDYAKPYVAIEIKYTEGLKGKNILNLKNDDVKMITDVMMGGTGEISEEPLNEMNLSAAGELMNQMMGASSTALSEMLSMRIDISPPLPKEVNYSEEEVIDGIRDGEEEVVLITFDLSVEGMLQSEIIQIMPLSFAKFTISKLKELYHKNKPEEIKVEKSEPQTQSIEPKAETQDVNTQDPQRKVNIQKVELTTFGEEKDIANYDGNRYDILMDVPLEVSVEIGRVNKAISEILKFNNGTIIELDKLVGEDVNIVINNRTIGKGEVVVIDECYGVRITEILENKNI